MKKLHAAILLLVSIFHYSQSTSNPVLPVFNGQNSDLSSVNENYVYTRTYLEPKTFSDAQAKQIQGILFFDGLGKPRQHVAIHTSPTGNDMVTHIPYDNFGRQVENWLPIPMISLNGDIQPPPSTSEYYKTTSGSADALIYEKKTLENSPLDRLQSYAGPGSDWLGKKISYDYQTNSNSEVFKFTTTTSWKYGATSSALNSNPISYPIGTLYKTIVTDEDGHSVTEFKNERGQTILTRKKEGSDILNTYYVYNEYNQLAFVIPPLASQRILANKGVITPDILDGLLYAYSYDGWNRLVEKKLPGKALEYMVYDQLDRLVMSQDGNLRSQGKWLFTKYDAFNRVAYTGLQSSPKVRFTQQAAINTYNTNPGEERSSTGFTDLAGSTIYYTSGNTYPQNNITVLSVNYYDTYPPGSPPNNSGVVTQSKLLASFIKNIEDNNWTKNYTYYDDKERVTGGQTINHLGGYTKIESTLAFSGVPLNTTTRHKKDSNSPEVKINETFTYDHQERLLKHTHRINDGAEETLAEYVYNELGQLQNKNVGNGIQSVAYRYNTRGALTHINDPNNLNNKLFGLQLKYTNPQSTAASYSGNIAEVDWATQSDGILRRYNYSYDGINRLLGAQYKEPKTTNPEPYYFNESVSYDVNGNIIHLTRFRKSPNSIFAEYVDGLSYTYDNDSNRMIKVKDDTNNAAGYPIGGNTITYDTNGNMTSHMDKGISSIAYNFLNLPGQITQNAGNILYSYRADGIKLRKTYGNITTDYLDGFQYTNGQLQFVPTSEGYYDFVKSKYIYSYTDHLGNIRVNYLKGAGGGAEIIEENNYYPFGLKHEGYNSIGLGNSNYKYGYLQNELQETGMYDMNARFYMPDLGRFMQHDPLSALSLDPYGYAFNNPVNFVDPTGLYGEDPPGSSSDNPIDIGNIVLNPRYYPSSVYGLPYTDGGYGSGNSAYDNCDCNSIYDNHYVGGNSSSFGSTNSNPLSWIGIRNMENFHASESILANAIETTKVGQSVSAAENFMFLELPAQFAGGALFSAGWRAVGAGRYIGNALSKITTVDGFMGGSIGVKLPFNLKVGLYASENTLKYGTFKWSTIAPKALTKYEWFGRNMLQITPEFQPTLGKWSSQIIPKGTNIRIGLVGMQPNSGFGTWLQFYSPDRIPFIP